MSNADDVEYTPVTPELLLNASEKLVRVNRGELNPDERDSLEYIRVHPLNRLLKERIQLDAENTLRNAMRRANTQKSLSGLKVNHFDKYQSGLLTSSLSLPLEEINPLHIVEQNRRITKLGPGGLSEQSITEEANNLHPSEFGFLSCIEGPESGKIGVDTRLAWGARIGSDGRIYQRFKNKRTGKNAWLSPKDLSGKVVGLPD